MKILLIILVTVIVCSGDPVGEETTTEEETITEKGTTPYIGIPTVIVPFFCPTPAYCGDNEQSVVDSNNVFEVCRDLNTYEIAYNRPDYRCDCISGYTRHINGTCVPEDAKHCGCSSKTDCEKFSQIAEFFKTMFNSMLNLLI